MGPATWTVDPSCMESTGSPRDDRVTFTEAFDDAPVGMALVEIDPRTGGLGRFLAVNRALCALGGYAREDLLAVGASTVISPDDREDAALLLKRLRDGQVSSFEAEQRLSRADGGTTRVAVTTSLVRGASGHRCALAHIQDITGRKAAEAALRVSERRYREIIETTHEGVWMLDAELRTTLVNLRMTELLGHAESEMLGRPVLAFMDDEMQAVVSEMFRQGRQGQQGQVEVRFTRRDGSDLWGLVSTSELLDDDGDHLGAVAMVCDITEHKRAEKELCRRVEREAAVAALVRRALDGGDLASLMQAGVDLGGAVLGADFCRAVELAPDARTFIVRAARGDSALLPVGESGAPVSGVSVPIKQGGSQLGVLSAYSAGQRRFTSDDTIFLERVANVLAAAIARTKTEQLETQLRQAQRLETVEQLAGGIAHDFNNLLGVILNCARLAMDDLDQGRPIREDIAAIVQAGERAADLTHRLLVFSRADDVEREVADMNGAVYDAATLLERTLGEHIEVVTDLAPDLWPVSVGAGQIEQVLINLALNCRDAMPGGGLLEITTDNTVLDAMAARDEWVVPAGAYARLTVHDTGHGMDPEIAARAFDPFFTTKPAGSGTGLGLATVYGIAKRAGGYVDIHSEPGRGTAVRLYLPAAVDEVDVPERADRRPEAARVS